MKPETIRRISLLLLAIGLGGAIVIYLTAKPATYDPLLGNPLDSKKFVHELGVMGGKGNVEAARLMDDFEQLWRGRNLAGTVAVLTVLVTEVFRFVALRPDLYASGSVSPKKPPVAS